MSSTSTAGPAPLGQLLSETFAYCKAHAASLGLGVVVFGLIMGAYSGFAEHSTSQLDMMGNGTGGGMNMAKMEEISARIEAGDETALADLQAALKDAPTGMNDQVKDAQTKMFMQKFLPLLGAGGIIVMLVSWFAQAYFALVAVEGKDIQGTIARAPRVMLPLVGISIWSFLRSFSWIALIGVVFGAVTMQWGIVALSFAAAVVLMLVFYPRFIAASLIYLAEGKGVMASVSESYKRTRGYWPKIVGNAIVAAIVIGLVSIVVSIVLGLVLSMIPGGASVAAGLVRQASAAFMMVFTIRLSHTILQHPRS